MLRNEFGTIPYGTQWNLFNSVQQSLDPTLSRWRNLVILMIYPFVFHLLALASSWLQTRPKSFWEPLEDRLHRAFPSRFEARDALARAGVKRYAAEAGAGVGGMAVEPSEPTSKAVSSA